jgi:hypothetical protein
MGEQSCQFFAPIVGWNCNGEQLVLCHLFWNEEPFCPMMEELIISC